MAISPENLQSNEQLEASRPNFEIVDTYVTNALVSKGVISAEEANSLEQDRLDELIIRSAHDFKQLPAIVPKTNIDKARKILGLSVEEGVLNDKSNRAVEIQVAESEMRIYLAQLKEKFPFVKGFILCGSRFNPHKIPTKDSDVDVTLILEEGRKSGSDTEEGRKLVDELVSYTRSKKSSSGFEVELDGFYTVSEYFNELNSDAPSTELKGKLVWGWDPTAIRYIGDPLKGQQESTVNEITQKRLNSKNLNSQRSTIIDRAKLTLLQEAQQIQATAIQSEQISSEQQESAARQTEATEIHRIRESLRE